MFAEGLKLFNSKRYEQAFKIFKEILALSPNNMNTLVILSQLCKKKNDFHQYEFYLKKIIEIDKKNYKALNNLATFSDVPTNVPKALHRLPVPVSRTKGLRHQNTELKKCVFCSIVRLT